MGVPYNKLLRIVTTDKLNLLDEGSQVFPFLTSSYTYEKNMSPAQWSSSIACLY